jgi:heat shock protein HslJ
MYMSVMPSTKMSPRVALQKDEWKLVTYNGKTLDHAATIKFEKNRFHAKVCNTMNSRYNLTITGKLVIRQGMSTMMYCEGDIMKVESLLGST